MSNRIDSLVRKETHEFFRNHKSWLMVCVGVGFVYIVHIARDDYRPFLDFIVSVAIMMSVGQYVFDSFESDISFKGALFLHNIGVKPIELFTAKAMLAMVITTVMLAASLPAVTGKLFLADILWIYPLTVFSASVMQISAVFSRGAEITSSIIALIGILLVLAAVFAIDHIILKSLVAFGVMTVAVLVCLWTMSSLAYRTQL